MDKKDSDSLFKLNSGPQEEYADEDEDLLWDKKKKNVISRWFKMPEDIPYSWLAIGCLVLIILFVLIFPKNKGEVSKEQFLAMEMRLKKLEDRIAKIEDVDEKITRIWEQAKDFEQFKLRFDRQEASLSLRLDNLTKDLNRMQQRKTEAKPAKAQTGKTKQAADATSKQKYHTVRSGETLYGISRQYGLTVEKLRLMNKLSKNMAIHPGQELLVKP